MQRHVLNARHDDVRRLGIVEVRRQQRHREPARRELLRVRRCRLCLLRDVNENQSLMHEQTNLVESSRERHTIQYTLLFFSLVPPRTDPSKLHR